MIINIIGDCDKRPVLYTIMKIAQTLGDVLLISSSSRLIRLSDTHDSYGHYQNVMIAITQDGIDDFIEEFGYNIEDFDVVIIDNIVAAEADLVFYVKGLLESEEEKSNLEYIDEYTTIDLYRGHYIDGSTMKRCEEFEAYKTMCPISPKIAEAIAPVLSKHLGVPSKNIVGIANKQTSTQMKSLPKDKPVRRGFGKR